MTYGRPPLEKIDLRELDRIEICPPARGPGSKTPDLALERWKAVREATVRWHHDDMPSDPSSIDGIEKDFFDGWDVIQRRVLTELFAAYRRLFPSDPTHVDLDPVAGVALHESTNRTIGVAVQVEVRGQSGVQALRIKTGRAGTSEIEAAAFYQPEERRTLVDLRLAADDAVTIPPPEDASQLVEDAANRWDRAVTTPRTGRVAGLHCYSCPRPARCGQYPVVGEGDVSRWTRTVLVSKSRLADVARCVRSAAWPVIYSIPRDDGDDEYDSAHLVVGNQFHRTVAAALVSDDPAAWYEAATTTVAPSEVADLRWLFDQHEAVWVSDPRPVSVARTEYQFGVTFVVDGVTVDRQGRVGSGNVAVTMMGVTDVNGWESAGVAAVVEHRTGSASSALAHEADLYAVSAWHALASLGRSVDGVAVHFHHLRADPAVCDREFYAPARIADAEARLREVARELAALHPTDASSPGYTTGAWCEWCQWVGKCLPSRA
ncbi:MAG: hypothetical protein WD990_13235 [Acidimicrobiia bacterium]